MLNIPVDGQNRPEALLRSVPQSDARPQTPAAIRLKFRRLQQGATKSLTSGGWRL